MNLIKKFWNSPEYLGMGEWDEWNKSTKTKYPIRWVIFEDIPDFFRRVSQRIKDIKYWIIHRTFDKYHVVKTGLAPNYYDIQVLMLHSSFSLLVRFVEEEKGLEVLNWDWAEDHKMVEKEIVSLYCWWINREKREERWEAVNPPPKEGGTISSLLNDEEYCDWLVIYGDQCNKWDIEDTENLIRLVKIKNYLWT